MYRAAATPSQAEIDTGEETLAAKLGARLPWPATLPEQVRAVAEVLAASRAPLALPEIEQRFTGRGPWKKRLPQIVETLIAAGRVRAVNGGRNYLAAN